jgi:benzil reductase ((S)-benzoin forming)
MEHYFITGVSSGIGLSLVKELLSTKQELNIHGCARRDPGIKDTRFHFHEMDLASVEQFSQRIADFFKLSFDKADRLVLINNAGILGNIAFVGDQDVLNYKNVMTVNSIAPMVFCEAFVKQFQHHPAEKIVFNISSGAASKDTEGWSAYCASKAALDRFTLVCAKEQMHHSVRVHFHTVSPGVVDTVMQEEIRKTPKAKFPLLDHFVHLHQHGELTSAHATAVKLLKVLNESHLRQQVFLCLRNF